MAATITAKKYTDEGKLVEIDSAVLNKPTANWVSLIYYPVLEQRKLGSDHLITQNRGGALIPFLRYFQFMTEEGMQMIQVHPGTNLGYHVRSVDNTEIIRKLPIEWFDSIFSQKLNKQLLDSGAIKPFYPVSGSDLEGEPSYADFSEEDALELVNSHTHEKWVNSALSLENRPVIKTASEKRKTEILKLRQKLQEGV